MILLFLVSKFHILVKYPCNIRFCCTINLTVRITKYRLDFDAIIQYQKDKMSLWSQTSVFRVLSPFGNSVPNFPYRYWYTLYLQSCQCLSLSTSAIKRLPPSRLFLDNYKLFWIVYSLPSQKITSRRYQSKPLVIIFCKIIFVQRAITNQSPLRFMLAWDNSPEFQNNNREILVSRCERNQPLTSLEYFSVHAQMLAHQLAQQLLQQLDHHLAQQLAHHLVQQLTK